MEEKSYYSVRKQNDELFKLVHTTEWYKTPENKWCTTDDYVLFLFKKHPDTEEETGRTEFIWDWYNARNCGNTLIIRLDCTVIEKNDAQDVLQYSYRVKVNDKLTFIFSEGKIKSEERPFVINEIA